MVGTDDLDSLGVNSMSFESKTFYLYGNFLTLWWYGFLPMVDPLHGNQRSMTSTRDDNETITIMLYDCD